MAVLSTFSKGSCKTFGTRAALTAASASQCESTGESADVDFVVRSFELDPQLGCGTVASFDVEVFLGPRCWGFESSKPEQSKDPKGGEICDSGLIWGCRKPDGKLEHTTSLIGFLIRNGHMTLS